MVHYIGFALALLIAVGTFIDPNQIENVLGNELDERGLILHYVIILILVSGTGYNAVSEFRKKNDESGKNE